MLYLPIGVFEIWRETCNIHFNQLWVYVVVYKSCKHGGEGVSTWDGHIYPVAMQKYISFIIHYEVYFCLHVK